MIFLGILIGVFIGVVIMCIFQINRTNKYLYKYELIPLNEGELKARCIIHRSDNNED